jgi:hypothetical protein
MVARAVRARQGAVAKGRREVSQEWCILPKPSLRSIPKKGRAVRTLQRLHPTPHHISYICGSTMIRAPLYQTLCFALLALTSLAAAAVEEGGEESFHPLRGQRRLPYDLDSIDLDSAELGFAVGLLCLIVLICCLLSMCCGGGRCSLWDCLALFCIWELCCDGRNPNDFIIL